jgi:hypothetical protein
MLYPAVNWSVFHEINADRWSLRESQVGGSALVFWRTSVIFRNEMLNNACLQHELWDSKVSLRDCVSRLALMFGCSK